MNFLGFVLAIPPTTNVQISQERIDALLAAGIFHFNTSGARDTDSIYNAQTMQCLTGYALRPFFHDPAHTVAMRIAYQEINQLQYALNRSIDTALQHKLNFDVDKTPKAARIKELQKLINKLEDAVQEKISSKTEKGSSKASAAPILHKRKRSSPMKKTLTNTTSPSSIPDAGNEKLVESKMMFLGSNRRIHSIHSTHQPSEATRENPIGGSTS